MADRTLTLDWARTARDIQQAIDEVAMAGGGTVVLPAVDTVLDRGLQLRSGVTLAGQGEATLLRKAPARVYKVPTYHNYGMCDLPLETTAGLEPGMTVAIHDEHRSGFYETFARITWVEERWVGLDRGLEADYGPTPKPVLITSFPLVFGEHVHDAGVRDLCLDGCRQDDEAAIGACRGAAVYFYRSSHCQVSGTRERAFAGEGLGFQLCHHMVIRDCQFEGNGGNGYHPGAGSTAALFERCVARGNGQAGFFFCVRANHISVIDCRFEGNTGHGVSVNTRDCHNLIAGCQIIGNGCAGVSFNATPVLTEVHSCRLERCRIAGNGWAKARAQVEIHGASHDLVLQCNSISPHTTSADAPAATGTASVPDAGIWIAPTARAVVLDGNVFDGCHPDIAAQPGSTAATAASFTCGYDQTTPSHLRHLSEEGESSSDLTGRCHGSR